MPAPQYVLSLDQGTTSSRAILFDHAGQPVCIAQEEFKQHYPEAGWVEHDATEIWDTQRRVVEEVLQKSGAGADAIAAVGITNQRETTVLWDRASGEPIGKAIVWQDRRTAEHCSELEAAGHLEMFSQRTGLRLDPYFSGTKLSWMLEHIPGARERAEAGELAFGTIDSWLIWQLTGGATHVTDASNACRTLLYNIHTGAWDEELCQILGIPAALLPEVVTSSGEVAQIASIPELKGVPIAGIAGDQQAALFGQACFSKGMAKCTYGTGCFLLLNTGNTPISPTPEGLLTTVAWEIDGKRTYALEGSVFMGGAVVQWLRDELGIIDSAEQVNELAESVDDSNGVYLVPAFAGLGAPHWDPSARGTIFGLTRGANKAHLARAALEGIGFQVGELLQAMEAGSGISLNELRTDGGASRSALLMQFQSDLLAREVSRAALVETTALGAAYLAGLASGFWSSTSELAERWAEGARYQPQRDQAEMTPLIAGWEKAVQRTKNWAD